MDDLAVRIAALVAILAVAVAVGLWRRRTDGRARAVDDGLRLTAEELGTPLATRATMVQFSSPICGSCASVRRVLSDVAAATPGVGHVEVDAADRLDLARRLSVLRTPTVLILGPGGEVMARSSGVPTRSQLSEALSLTGV